MDLQRRLIYQDLIANTTSMDQILDVFERALAARGLWDSEARLAEARVLAEERGRPEDVVRIHDAFLIGLFLETFEPDDVEEYVNLARKERLARVMLRELNHGKADTARVLALLNEFCALPLGRYQVSETVTLGIRVDLISQFISDHLSYIGIAKNHITMRDAADALRRAIGTGVSRGRVGGKAAGMLLANRILRPTLEPHDPLFDECIQEPESYFLKSSVASEFVDSNRLEECHSLKYLEGDAVDEARERIGRRFMRGRFGDAVLDQLRDVLFSARKDFASAIVKDIEYVVRVDSAAYGALTSGERKMEVARIAGRVNRALAGKRFVLMGPGRWGTTDLELGVRVQYSEINSALMLIEVARKKGDVTPEVSHGAHFFQDLVEADIIPLPLYPDDDGVVFRSAFFENAANRLAGLDPARRLRRRRLRYPRTERGRWTQAPGLPRRPRARRPWVSGLSGRRAAGTTRAYSPQPQERDA